VLRRSDSCTSPRSQSWRRETRLRWEGFVENLQARPYHTSWTELNWTLVWRVSLECSWSWIRVADRRRVCCQSTPSRSYPAFIPGIFFEGGIPPDLHSPQTAVRFSALNFFSAGTLNYKYITETFFQWTVMTGNYSSLCNRKGANVCLKCTKIRLAAGRTRWGACALSQTPQPQWGPTSKVRREGRDLLLRGTGGKEGERERKGRGGNSPPRVKMSRINTAYAMCFWQCLICW